MIYAINVMPCCIQSLLLSALASDFQGLRANVKHWDTPRTAVPFPFEQRKTSLKYNGLSLGREYGDSPDNKC